VPIFIGRGAPLLDIARYDRLTALVRDALGLVARARGMGGIAKKAGLNRESLYKALGETGNPEFGTVMRIVRALGLTLSARPVASGQTSKRRRVA
jgi:probable addiction module antidote protein